MAGLLAEHQTISSLEFSRSGLDFESAIPQKQLARCDLITFLGVAQKLGLEFLPITWQPALDSVGQGATAEIREAIVTTKFSFAFKRPISRFSFDSEESENPLLRCLIDEISILSHPLIRKHPNIVDLEGICWEIIAEKGMRISREVPIGFSAGGQGIRPVLVFQKSKHGDLYDFMVQGQGKSLDFSSRIDICIDVARAVSEMHSQSIIHGDIKPQNVLIFDNNSSGYTAKVADFGYSTQWATASDLIQMPRSQPWAAPEWHHRGFTPAQATLMDTYSFGMLVLWLISYTDQNGSDRYFKIGSQVASKAAELIPQVVKYTLQMQKMDLSPFFDVTLAHNTADRCSDFRNLQKLLSPERIKSDIQIIRPSGCSGPTKTEHGFCVDDVILKPSLRTANFQVIPSMYQLYQADYRVRIYIGRLFLRKLSCLEENQSSNLLLQNTLLQCAICYEIGFGIKRDPKKSQELLEKCRDDDRTNFYRELDLVKCNQYDWNIVRFSERTNYQKMDLAPTGNNTPRHNLYHSYIAQEDLQVVECEYRKEIADTEIGLGPGHRFVLELKTELIHILLQCGQHREAEKLKAQVKETVANAPGHEQPRALAAKSNLAVLNSMLKGHTRIEDTRVFCLQVASLASEDFGHLATIDALCALASIAEDQRLLKEAEDPSTQILGKSSKMLGQEHPNPLNRALSSLRARNEQVNYEKALGIINRVKETCKKILDQKDPVGYLRPAYLVWTLALQKKWTEAEALQTEIVHQDIKALGPENANTLSSMNQLAVIFLERGQLQKSKVLYLQVVELSEKILGKEHPKTLDFLNRLAKVYQQQQHRRGFLAKLAGKRRPSEQVEKLHKKVAALSAKTLGVEHPSTLFHTTWWAWVLYEQSRFEEAEKLEMQIVETRERVLGEKHPETLASYFNLAFTVRKQGRWKEAQELMSKGVKTKPFLSRVIQQIQLFLLLIR